MTDPIPNPDLPVDPQAAQRQQEASGGDTLGGVSDAIDASGVIVDAASLAIQAGGVVLDAGVASVKVAAEGAEIIGSLLGGLFDAL